MKILLAGGTRPNFMKLAPLLRELGCRQGVECEFVHTGQHYDPELSDVFFRDLSIPDPKWRLSTGSGSHAIQTARVLEGMEPVIAEWDPDILVAVGDVNSTMASALTAAKLGVRVAHVEAGLRCFDRTMPEEVNRVVTDHLSDLLFVSEEAGMKNLAHEGLGERAYLVGNTMADSLYAYADRADASHILSDIGLTGRSYALFTAHRAMNVTLRENAYRLTILLEGLAKRTDIVFPVHPRTLACLGEYGLLERLKKTDGLHLLPPLGYLEFLGLMKGSVAVVTDSGGIAGETTMLGIPCLTLREKTEQPVTVGAGTNALVGLDAEKACEMLDIALAGDWKKGFIPPLWDGGAAKRIVDILADANF